MYEIPFYNTPMAFGNRRQIIVSVAVAVVLALSLFAVAVTYFPAQQIIEKTSTSSANPGNGANSSNTSINPIVSESTSSTVSSDTGPVSTAASSVFSTTTSTAFFIGLEACGQNCTLNIPWITYPTVEALKGSSEFVVLANVTSAKTIKVEGVPVTNYNITVVTMLFGESGQKLPPGYVLPVSQIGGTVSNFTMHVGGYPQLTTSGTYLFFLTLPGSFLEPYYGPSWISVGGPQGTFVVEGGKVSSLDNLYPQDEAWLPVKVDGIPLDQFILEVQSSSTSSTIEQGTTTSFAIAMTKCGGNCTLNIPWQRYQTLDALKAASDLVVLANVTSTSASVVNGVPIIHYSIMVVRPLKGSPNVTAGFMTTVAQFGGTTRNSTLHVNGYPSLTIGKTYVFFLGTQDTSLGAYSYFGQSEVTVGGPQGLFYVQGVGVYSLDNMYPEDDAWLPVKAEGVPLDQFISEIQSTSTVSTSPIQTLPASSSSQPITSGTENSISSTSSISQPTLRGIGGITDVRFIYAGTAVVIVIIVAVGVTILRRRGRLR